MVRRKLVRRLLAVLPPRYKHLTSFHGVFAAGSASRKHVVPNPERKLASVVEEADEKEKPEQEAANKGRRPRLDWAALQMRTFGTDVWACRCGGRRQVVALVTSPAKAEEILR